MVITPNSDVNLGPLFNLAGVWEGNEGVDVAPSPERGTVECNYSERAVFESIGRVDNHEQILFGLRYSMTAWRLEEDDPFHEELGYWLWDAAAKQVLRCFMVPRGVTLIAGGTVESDSTSFELRAEIGSETYGICVNEFLAREFRMTSYRLKLTQPDQDQFSYEAETILQMKGRPEPFQHIDRNTLRRIK